MNTYNGSIIYDRISYCKRLIYIIQENNIISLYDTIENRIFNDIDYQILKRVEPLWMTQVGRSAETDSDKVYFENKIKENNNYVTNKILYWHDFENLVDALSDRFSMVRLLIDKFYEILPYNVRYNSTDHYQKVIKEMNEKADLAHTYLNNIFISLASSFDILTKIAFELNALGQISLYNKYPKLCSLSSGTLYKPSVAVDTRLKSTSTLFEDPYCVRKIITLRNEFIHNGAWDYRPTIYTGFIDGVLIDSWIFCPDTDNRGNLISSRSRNKFYSLNEKINATLPALLQDVLNVLHYTINKINDIYQLPRYSDNKTLMKFDDEIKNWSL